MYIYEKTKIFFCVFLTHLLVEIKGITSNKKLYLFCLIGLYACNNRILYKYNDIFIKNIKPTIRLMHYLSEQIIKVYLYVNLSY